MNAKSFRPRSIKALALLLAAGSLATAASAQIAANAVAGGPPALRQPAPAIRRAPVDPSRTADSFGVVGAARPMAPAAPRTDPSRPVTDQVDTGPGGGGGGGGVTDVGVQTVDFESLSHDDGDIANIGEMYIEDGWVVSMDPGQPNPFASFGMEEARYPGSTALFNRNVGGVSYFYAANGAPFTLVSLDVSNLNADGTGSTTFIGHRWDGTTVSRTCTTSVDANRLETFYFTGFNNLYYVEWVQDAPFHQFDNLRVARAPITMDFESLAVDNAGSNDVGTSYYEDGFIIAQGNGEPSPLEVFGLQSPKFPGSTALFNNTAGGTITLTDYLGGAFNLHSIDLSNLNNNGPTSVTFIGTREGNATIQKTFKIQGAPNGLQHFEFDGFTDLTSLTWTQDNPYHQFDNIVLSHGRAVMDFTKLSIADNNSHGWSKHYREDGFQLDTDSGPGYYTFGTLDFRWPGSTTLFDNGSNGHTTLTAIDGSPFGAISIALASLNGAYAQEVLFTGVRPNGDTIQQKFKISGNGQRLETFNFDDKFRRLVSLQWDQVESYHQFDAITLAPTITKLIDFQSLEHTDGGYAYVGSTYEEEGFRIARGQGDAHDLATYGTASGSYPGSTALFNNTAGGTVRLSTISGNDFDLMQMDVSRLANIGDDGSITFVGHKSDGSTIQQSYTYYGPSVGLQTVHFIGFDTLDYVEWTQSSPFHQFDNIAVVESVPTLDCYADFDGNGVLDLFDFLAYVNAFNAADASANCDGNGSLDLFDFLCYVNAFNAGC